MDDGDVLAIINSINTSYMTKQTMHMLSSEHFDESEARSRPERPCGYFTVQAWETLKKTKVVKQPDPSKMKENFPELGMASKVKQKRGFNPDTISAMIDVTVEYTEQSRITNLKRTDLSKLNQKTHMNQLMKSFFWSLQDLAWSIETQTSGPHLGSQVALVRGPIPAPYGGMTDAMGGIYRATSRMVVVLGGTGGANYQVITAYPV